MLNWNNIKNVGVRNRDLLDFNLIMNILMVGSEIVGLMGLLRYAM